MQEVLKGKIKTSTWDKIKSTVLVYAILVALLIVSEIISPGFLAPSHMESIIRQSAFIGIVCVGQTLVILTGGIDLSVSFSITLLNLVAAQMIDGQDENLLAAAAVVLVLGAFIGLVNGLGVRFLKIPPLVMTLGMGSILQGITLVYTNGAPKGHSSPFLEFLSTGKVMGIVSGVILIWIVLSAITIIVLKKTIFGRSIYSIGTNIVASKYSGVKISSVSVSVYTISGIMSAITAMLLLGYTGTSFTGAGDPYNMNSITAVVIGGTSVLGGAGGYVGTIAGCIIMIVLSGILTVINMPESGRQIVQGLIIIVMLLLVYSKNKEKSI